MIINYLKPNVRNVVCFECWPRWFGRVRGIAALGSNEPGAAWIEFELNVNPFVEVFVEGGKTFFQGVCRKRLVSKLVGGPTAD